MKKTLVDFYFVFSVWNAPNTTAWHVTVRDVAESMEDVKTLGGVGHRDRVLSIEQAKAEGLDVKAIEKFINADVAQAHEHLRASHAELERKSEEGVGVRIDELEVARKENANLISQNSDLKSKLALSVKPQKKSWWK